MKIVNIKKGFSRKVSDDKFGSFECVMEVEAEVEINDGEKEKLIEINNKLGNTVRILVEKELQDFIKLKNEGKAI